ncbi:type II toxin-antitoxin system HicA family toxin [Candidatus Nomurabacteria bacterium]|nr:type II toxin-antitoxin system HicA family toxin [Candidatus Nomurabacteria bacterium]
MPKLALIKPLKLKKILIKLGFEERDAEGSHIFLAHKDGRTTVIPMKKTDISRGLLRKILNDCNISVDEYNRLRKNI